MDSKEDTSLTGFSSVSSDKIETVNETNGVKSVNKVDSNKVSSLNAGSDDEGFASGEEEAFETNIDGNSEAKSNVDEGADSGEKFSEASEFLQPKIELSTVSDEVVDDAEKGNLGLVEKGTDDKREPDEKLTFAEVVKKEAIEVDKVENEVVTANGEKLTTEGDSVVEEIKVDTPAPGLAVVTNTEDVEDDDDEDEDVLLVGGPESPDRTSSVAEEPETESVIPVEEPETESVVPVEEPETESVVPVVVNVTPEVDSVVEAIDVDLPVAGVPGVAVVTKTEEDSDAVTDEPEKIDRVLEEVVDKEVVEVTNGQFSPVKVEDVTKTEKNPEAEVEKEVDYESKETGSVVALDTNEAPPTEISDKNTPEDTPVAEVLEKEIPDEVIAEDNIPQNGPADKFVLEDSKEDSPSDEETDGVIFGSSEAAKQFMEELERGSNTGESSQDRSNLMDGQIVTDSDEEDDEEEDGKELFDSAALAALLKAAADGSSEGGNITFSSQDGSRLFTVERPAGLGPSLRPAPATRPARSNLFNPLMSVTDTETNLSEDERKKLEKLQNIRVKFLRLVHRLGLSPDESVAAQVLYRLALIAGRQTGQSFSLESAKRKAAELESEGNDDLDFSVNILVIGKAGVGKSATINSIFGEDKTVISAFQPATSSVKEIRGVVGGVDVRVFDTPGLRPSIMDQSFNRSVLSSAKRFTKKNPADIVLYVDRLDAQTRDHNDIPLLKNITNSLGAAIWRSAIVTFTHAASAPPEGSNGNPLSYEMFVTQRSHVVQQAIGHAVGDLRMMSPSLMNPVSLVENHNSCRKNRDGQKVLPNGQTWRPQLLMLCYSMKILAEANALSKPQDPYDNRKLFGFRVRSPPLPYMLSSMLQSRAHPKLTSENGGDGGDSDVDLADLSESDDENEDEYDNLPPFKPLKKTQLAKLSREQKKAYFDEYDYRVKLLQKKQFKEEVKRMKEAKKRAKDGVIEDAFKEEEGEGDAPAPVAVPLPDMALPPSFDSDNPAYRFRFLEPTSQFLARPVLDTHGWDHDCGYDGVNLEQSLAIANRFPGSISVQVTKDKKDFSINMDSSIAAKYGENISTMAGFDVQPIGKQLAYIVRAESKFKNLKRNKTAAGMSVTFLGENVVTGFKVEDQVQFGKQYSVIGSAGTVRFQSDSAYGANVEIQRRELEYPIGQVQSTVGLSIIKWRGDLALGFNSLAQFSVGRNAKIAVRAGINNKMSGQITVKTSSSEHLTLALVAVIPSLISAYKKMWAGAGEKSYGY